MASAVAARVANRLENAGAELRALELRLAQSGAKEKIKGRRKK
jgi:hypothetical protein